MKPILHISFSEIGLYYKDIELIMGSEFYKWLEFINGEDGFDK